MGAVFSLAPLQLFSCFQYQTYSKKRWADNLPDDVRHTCRRLFLSFLFLANVTPCVLCLHQLLIIYIYNKVWRTDGRTSPERRCSSRTFPYGYLVTP